MKKQSKKHHRLFVDPASISSGWALFADKKLVDHGTIAVSKKWKVWERLDFIQRKYSQLLCELQIQEVHIEQLFRNTHIFTHYSVGVIGAALWRGDVSVAADISVKKWETYCDWHGKRKRLASYKEKVNSEDELAAIGMGLYWVNSEH